MNIINLMKLIFHCINQLVQMNILGMMFSSDVKIIPFIINLDVDEINHIDGIHHVDIIHHIDEIHSFDEIYHEDEILHIDEV